MTDDTNQLRLDGIEASDPSSISAADWIARSYESMEEWKKRAREVFFSVNGDSHIARNRVAAIVRTYFVETPPQAEDVKRWKKGVAEIETIRVSPPKISASNSAYIDWLCVADLLLLGCGSTGDRLDEENQKRENEFRLVHDSYRIRKTVYDARTELRKNPNAAESELLRSLTEKHPKAALAHIKEAKKLERSNVRHTPPKEPVPSSPMPRFKPIYFQGNPEMP